MIANCATNEHIIAHLSLIGRDVNAFRNDSHTAGVDVDPIPVPFVHHFCITRDQLHTRRCAAAAMLSTIWPNCAIGNPSSIMKPVVR